VFKFLKIFSKKDLKHASAGSVVIKFGSAFFAFLNSVLLARYLSVEGFGYYILAFSTMILLSLPITSGIPKLITRYVSKYEVHSNFGAIKGLLIKANRFAIFCVLIIYIIAVLTYFFWWHRFNSILVETMLYSLLLLPILGLGALRSAALRGLKLVILADLPDTLFRNFMLTLCILVSVLFSFQLTPQLAIIFQIISASLGFLLGYIFLQKKLLGKIKNVPARYDETREWIKQTIPFSINSGVPVVKSRAIIYILAIFGSIEIVAVYEVAIRGAALVSLVLDALNMAIAPFVSSAFEKGELRYIQKIVKKTSRIIFLFSVPVALIFIFGGDPLLQWIFGVEYSNSYIPLVILCVGQLFSALIGSVGLVLNMTGNQIYLSRSNIIALVLTFILIVPAVIYFGVIGAAIVFSCVLIFQNIQLMYFTRKRLNINTTVF